MDHSGMDHGGMDHGGMDHGGMDHGDMCSMNMLFTWDTNVTNLSHPLNSLSIIPSL